MRRRLVSDKFAELASAMELEMGCGVLMLGVFGVGVVLVRRG